MMKYIVKIKDGNEWYEMLELLYKEKYINPENFKIYKIVNPYSHYVFIDIIDKGCSFSGMSDYTSVMKDYNYFKDEGYIEISFDKFKNMNDFKTDRKKITPKKVRIYVGTDLSNPIGKTVEIKETDAGLEAKIELNESGNKMLDSLRNAFKGVNDAEEDLIPDITVKKIQLSQNKIFLHCENLNTDTSISFVINTDTMETCEPVRVKGGEVGKIDVKAINNNIANVVYSDEDGEITSIVKLDLSGTTVKVLEEKVLGTVCDSSEISVELPTSKKLEFDFKGYIPDQIESQWEEVDEYHISISDMMLLKHWKDGNGRNILDVNQDGSYLLYGVPVKVVK